MKLLVAVILSIGLLSGCSQKSPELPQPTVVHPSWPDQIKPWNGHWTIVEVDGRPFVGMPYSDSQEFRIWLNDVLRYTKDANGMICYYRSELKEPKCVNSR